MRRAGLPLMPQYLLIHLMSDHAVGKTFRLAPMSPVILSVTLVLLILPLAFLLAAMVEAQIYLMPGLVVIALYAWIWLRFRPNHFILSSRSLKVIWPLKRYEISRESIAGVRLLDRDALKQEIGWGMRIGAGGLGGGFGWLWTKRHGLVQIYVSRTDRFVWIERTNERPWLITPEQPEAFVRALSV